jgi:hypothetical protein
VARWGPPAARSCARTELPGAALQPGGFGGGEQAGGSGGGLVPAGSDGGVVVDVFGDGLVAGPGGAADAGLGVGVGPQSGEDVLAVPVCILRVGSGVAFGCREP